MGSVNSANVQIIKVCLVADYRFVLTKVYSTILCCLVMRLRSLLLNMRSCLCVFARLSVFIMLLTLASAPLSAQQKNSKEQTRQTSDLNKTQAADRARQKVKGRVLKVEKQKNQYRVKVLQKSGRVVSVDVDKSSGKVNKSVKKKKQQ